MKRIRIIGLCLVAVFAFSALVAAAAQATVQPEFKLGVCVAQKKGNFTESGCKTVAEKTKKGISEPDHKGTYELTGAPCVAQKKGNYLTSACNTEKEKKGIVEEHKGKYERTSCYPSSCASFPYKFTAKSESGTSPKITAHSTTGTPEAVTCSKSTGAGEVTSASGSKETVTFEGCKNAGGEPCTSFTGEPVASIAAPETIEAIKSSPELYWLESGEKGIGILDASESSETLKFYCGSEAVYKVGATRSELEATGKLVIVYGTANGAYGSLIGTVVNTGTGETITYKVNGSGEQEQKFVWYEEVEYQEGPMFTEPGKVEATVALVEERTGAGVS